MNVLTEYLSSHFPESDSSSFYRELFPINSLANNKTVKGMYSPVLVRCIKQPDGSEKAERHLVFDDLSTINTCLAIDSSLTGVTDLLSPVSYAGRRPMLNRAHELFALVFDLDELTIEDGKPVGLEDLLFQMETLPERSALIPTPTYIVSSGTGLHLYYMLEEPLRMWPNVCERLSEYRDSLTRRLWNKYVTDLSDKPQLESVVQAFRMVGSRSKSGDQIIRAFKTGERVSIDYMNSFVPKEVRIDNELFESKYTLKEAREKWPTWDPNWRQNAAKSPSCKWRIKRDLYDWWCRRVEAGEPFEGNRYWCLFVAACYAAKCPDVTYEELEEWAHRIAPTLDRLTKRKGNEFTSEDVQAALAAYGNPISVKLRRDKVKQKTQLPMPVNKRNGRKLHQHITMVNETRRMRRDVLGEDEYKNSGRPKESSAKRDIIRSYAIEHPEANHSHIAQALGVSRPTVIKWLKGNWKEDYIWGKEWENRSNITPIPLTDEQIKWTPEAKAVKESGGQVIGLNAYDLAKVAAGTVALPNDTNCCFQLVKTNQKQPPNTIEIND